MHNAHSSHSCCWVHLDERQDSTSRSQMPQLRMPFHFAAQLKCSFRAIRAVLRVCIPVPLNVTKRVTYYIGDYAVHDL